MIKVIVCCLLALGVSGCHTIIKKEVVAVDKPIPFIPEPPEFPEYKLLTEQLTEADKTDPGKVAQYYRHDLTLLKQLVEMQRQVIERYRAASKDFKEVSKKIDQLFTDINTKLPEQK